MVSKVFVRFILWSGNQFLLYLFYYCGKASAIGCIRRVREVGEKQGKLLSVVAHLNKKWESGKKMDYPREQNIKIDLKGKYGHRGVSILPETGCPAPREGVRPRIRTALVWAGLEVAPITGRGSMKSALGRVHIVETRARAPNLGWALTHGEFLEGSLPPPFCTFLSLPLP